MAKNLTPSHLRCGGGACPSLHQLEDGRLLVVGENISDWEALKHGVQVDPKGNETAIIISPDLLSDYVAEQVTAEGERCARIEAIADVMGRADKNAPETAWDDRTAAEEVSDSEG